MIRRLALACVLALVLASTARADGDPPSDVLVGQDVYYGFGLDLTSKEAVQLYELLALARERGFELKVALVADYSDLGLVGAFWQKPAEYVRYLGDELSLVYRERLLVVMRNGYGIYRGGRVPGKDRRVLSQLPRPGRTVDFYARTIDTVKRLAAANGVRLEVPDVGPSPTPVSNAANAHEAPAVTPPSSQGATPTPTPPPATREAAASGNAWLFLTPVGLFVVGALALIGVSRRRNTD